MEELQILNDYESVEPYLEVLRRAADQNKTSLGFLPASVFSEYARRAKLWVAISSSGQYRGHLLFDRKFPKATIIQMYSEPSSRRSGVATAMLSALKDALTVDGYLTIRASVAEDLAAANSFWERQGFYIQSKRPGGQTTRRIILVRVHELKGPQLFERSGLEVTGSDSLGLAHVAAQIPLMYLVDLNIIFDVAKRRPQHDAAARLFRAAHAGECRIAISDEMQRELHREAQSPHTDPMLCLIDSLPCVRLPATEETGAVLEGVAKLVFPEKVFPGQLSKNDLSDVRHVATAILCKLAGFVTRDHRILRAAADLEAKYYLQILAPTEFGTDDLSHGNELELELSGMGRVQVTAYESAHYDQVRALLLLHGIRADDMVGFWLPRGSQDGAAATLVAKDGEVVVGYILASRFEPRARCTRIRAIVDERCVFSEDVARILLLSVMKADVRSAPGLFELSVADRQADLRDVASSLGFRATRHPNALMKVAVNKIVLEHGWSDFRVSLGDLADLRLPAEAPSWESHQQQVEVICADGNRRFVRLDALETLLSPILFGFSRRPAVIVPIQPRYSEALLGNSRQLSLAPRMQLEASESRMYLADPRSLSRYTKGGIILFYESGPKGQMAVVALARILDVHLIRRDELGEESLRRSVLNQASLSKIGKSKEKLACIFDNLIHLAKPVELARLRSIGIRSSSLVTAKKIDGVQLGEILRYGCADLG